MSKHTFVSVQTETLARFRAAIASEDVDTAMTSARGVGYIGLGDTLDLVRLLARKADPRFDRAANRWLSRWLIEKGASVGDLAIATAAMSTLAVEPDSQRAIAALRAVLSADV
jgi:hypothetical protein